MQDFPEIRTLIFTLTVITVCRAAALAYVWMIAREFKPVRYWAYGSVLVGTGVLLVGLRNIISPVASIFIVTVRSVPSGIRRH